MNCSSDAGNPVVDMDIVIGSTPVMASDGTIYSEISVIISRHHQKSIFICLISTPEKNMSSMVM